MKLKGRLKLVCDKVKVCGKVCDVGTDHAFIPIYLVKNNVCDRAVAGDVKKGPLQVAVNNIRKYGLEDRIEARLGYGLDVIEENEANTIIIAGMGGELITQILSRGYRKAKSAQTMVIQPMNAVGEVRRWLFENGFDVYDEELAAEGNKIYCVMSARWDGKTRNLGEINYFVGEKLIERNDRIVKDYIQKKIEQIDRMIAGLSRTNRKDGEVKEKYRILRDSLKKIMES
ncbi:MAG: class I SAM-dependent methyltransferase [Clostridiales bacterium]|nr:class I SAM-dependent methyltransferase [Eubacteriales bacterium]MDH7565303.1 class I SAM-dependent methyltransferase [Clostridiales bacterium]